MNWRFIVLALFLIGVGEFVGNLRASWTYKPLLATCQERADGLVAQSATLQAAIGHQNEAIAAMQKQGEALSAQATAAVAVAQKQSTLAQTRAKAVLEQPAPVGVDPCTAAQQAFDAALKEERGLK